MDTQEKKFHLARRQKKRAGGIGHEKRAGGIGHQHYGSSEEGPKKRDRESECIVFHIQFIQ
jgi:hypothetical protein